MHPWPAAGALSSKRNTPQKESDRVEATQTQTRAELRAANRARCRLANLDLSISPSAAMGSDAEREISSPDGRESPFTSLRASIFLVNHPIENLTMIGNELMPNSPDAIPVSDPSVEPSE